MRRGFMGILTCLLALGLGPGLLPEAAAAPRTGGAKKYKTSRPEQEKAYSLKDIMREPKAYENREVLFYCRFVSTTKLFKTINTRFNPSEHVNFAVWPDKTVLWEEKGRRDVLPTLYVAKDQADLIEALRTLRKYELIAVVGEVQNVYGGYPWILVSRIERAEQPEDRLSEPVIQHMQSALEALAAGFGGTAARHFEQAVQFGVPPEYVSAAYESAARAYLLDNRLDRARDYLRLALERRGDDSLLNLALADVTLRMNDPAEALAHCEFAKEHSGRHPQVYGIMGEARSLRGEFAAAFADLNAAARTPGLTDREKAMLNVRRARVHMRAGRNTEAARLYAAVSEPGEQLAGEAWLHYEIGLFYESLYLESRDSRYLDDARKSYEEASKLSPTDPIILYSLAECEFRRQKENEEPDYGAVRAVLERIREMEPENIPARIIEGRILYAEGEPEKAESLYQSVAGQIGGNAVSLLSLAEAYLDLGRISDAVDALNRARAIEPWNPRVRSVGDGLENAAKSDVKANILPSGLMGAERRPAGRANPAGLAASGPRPAAPRGARLTASSSSAGSVPGGAVQARATVRKVTVLPGEGIRVGAEGAVSVPDRLPPDIQTSVQPAPRRGRAGYPVTEVRLPPAETPVAAENEPEWEEPLDLGFNPGSLDNRDVPEFGEEEYGEDEGVPPAWPPEARPREERRYGPVGMGISASEAYASLAPDQGVPHAAHFGAAPAFTFDPGRSPVLIDRMRAPAAAAARLPVRNPYVHRQKPDGGRQPAEIIEKEPAAPPPVPDLSGMTPPNGSATPRAEVRLPASAIGIGMASDFVSP